LELMHMWFENGLRLGVLVGTGAGAVDTERPA
jgi:hypothetical protein